MSDIWRIILGLCVCVAIPIIFFGLMAWSGSRRYKRNQINQQEYLERTETCPHCYGRGRIPKKGWHFVDDRYKKKYEAEERLKEIPEPFRKAFDK